MRLFDRVKANEKLADVFSGGPDRRSNASGGIGIYGSKRQFEVLTADDIYWHGSVDHSAVNKVASEIRELPEIKEWVGNAAYFEQNRMIEFEVIGARSKPILRILFLCNNLPGGEVVSNDFMENVWRN